MTARTLFVANCYIFPWTRPYRDLLKACLEGYHTGFLVGDTDNAVTSILIYIILSHQAGQSLELLRSDCDTYYKQMKDLRRTKIGTSALCFWQYALNMMIDKSGNNTTLLQGEVIEDRGEFYKSMTLQPPILAIINTLETRLCVVFGEHEKGANMFRDHGYDWPTAGPGHPMFMEMVCCGGLSSYIMARTTSGKKNRNYRKYAFKARSTIKGWAKHGNPNIQHFEALLDAEHDVLKGKKHCYSAEKNYHLAIRFATRGGYTHDAAICNECYGNFMLHVLKDEEGSQFYFKKALEHYKEWGATKKVSQLQMELDQGKGVASTVYLPR